MPIAHQIDRLVDVAGLHRCNPDRYPHFLKSAGHGRFDILFAFPGESLVLDDGGLSGSPAGDNGDFLSAFDAWWQRESLEGPPESLPFSGGWFVYLGYELAGQIEPRLQLPAERQLPLAQATRFRTAVINDRLTGTASIVAEPGSEVEAGQVRKDVESRLPVTEAVLADCAQISEQEPQRYLDAIERVLDYIREGDVFQVNLSREWQVRLASPLSPVDLYTSLENHNPSPFGGLATLGSHAIVSSSPERLVSVHGGVVETRPIAGTRPRGEVAVTDSANASELLANPKERAEHIMLIDLERNDLGRVCIPGSVEVNEMMVLESYAHVHHIVSNVRGSLRKAATPGDVIRAVFPGGTITGCPKVRCMEIIAELENEPRGAYTGSMGYINRDGSMDLNILIRTMVCHGDMIRLRAGAGIVADSDPVAELDETRAKARGLLRSLGIDNA